MRPNTRLATFRSLPSFLLLFLLLLLPLLYNYYYYLWSTCLPHFILLSSLPFIPLSNSCNNHPLIFILLFLHTLLPFLLFLLVFIFRFFHALVLSYLLFLLLFLLLLQRFLPPFKFFHLCGTSSRPYFILNTRYRPVLQINLPQHSPIYKFPPELSCATNQRY